MVNSSGYGDLTSDEKNHLLTALSQINATQRWLDPLVERSKIVARVNQHLRDVNLLLALAIAEKPEVSSRNNKLFKNT